MSDVAQVAKVVRGDSTRYWLNLVHEHRLRMEGAVENALLKMAPDTGWAKTTLPIMFLAADISALRNLADKMEDRLSSLTQVP